MTTMAGITLFDDWETRGRRRWKPWQFPDIMALAEIPGVLSLFRRFDFGRTFEDFGFSRRLQRQGVTPPTDLAAALPLWNDLINALLRNPRRVNSDRGGIGDGVAETLAAVLLVGYPGAPLPAGIDAAGLAAMLAPDHPASLRRHLEATSPVLPPPSAAPAALIAALDDHEPPLALMAAAVDRLPARSRLAIGLQYGIGGGAPVSTDETAAAYDVTRERIRQISRSGFERLSMPRNVMAFRRFLAANGRAIWDDLGVAAIRQQTVTSLSDRLDPWARLSIDLLHGSLKSWIQAVGIETTDGWRWADPDPGLAEDDAEDDLPPADLAAIWLRHAQLPVPLPTAAAQIGMETGALNEMLSDGHAGAVAETDWIFSRADPERSRIAIPCLARRHFGSSPFTTAELTAVQRAAGGSSAVFDVMKALPHLFFRMAADEWVALDETLPFDPAAGRPRLPPGHDFTAGSIGDRLYRLLAANGPMPTHDIARAMGFSARETGWSTVIAWLTRRSEFIHLMPGIFGLVEDLDRIEAGHLPIAPTASRQVIDYTIARGGGAPERLFPAWTQKFEIALCQWAKAHAAPELFQRLLAAVDPGCWPETTPKRDQWIALRTALADRPIPDTDADVPAPALPPPRAVLAAAIHLRRQGSLHQSTMSRLALQRIDMLPIALPTMGLLAALGLLRPGAQWRAIHAAGDRDGLDRLIAESFDDLRHFGALVWGAGAFSTARFGRIAPADLPAWWPAQSQQAFLETLRKQLKPIGLGALTAYGWRRKGPGRRS